MLRSERLIVIQPALVGALVANLDVDQNFIPSIEAALGRNLQAIVLKDAQLAPEIIATLKEKTSVRQRRRSATRPWHSKEYGSALREIARLGN
jgi:hypothetical protein